MAKETDFHLRPRKMRRLPRQKRLVTTRNAPGGRLGGVGRSARCTAKVGYTNKTAKGSAKLAQHLKYIARDSATNHSRSGDFKILGPGKPADFARFIQGEKRVWKIMLSPEEFHSMDPEVFAWCFMGRLQALAGFYGQGQYADWMGYIHTNTEAPHIHLLVRGVTPSGEDFLLRETSIGNLHKVAAEVQNTLTRGFLASRELQDERRRASHFLPLPKVENYSLDTLLINTADGTTYERILESVPRYRRRALHARMIYLEKTGLLTFSVGGGIQKAENFLAKFRGTTNLFRFLIRNDAVLHSNPKSLSLSSAGNTPLHGIVSSVTYVPHLGRSYGVFETLSDHAVAFEVKHDDLKTVVQLRDTGAMARLAKNAVTVSEGEIADRLDKLHARGKVINQLRKKYPSKRRDDIGW